MPQMHLIMASHGTSDPTGQGQIARLRQAIHRRLATHPAAPRCHEAYVDVQHPRIEQVLARIPREEPVVVLPLLVCDGVHTLQDIDQAIAGHDRAVCAPPLSSHTGLAPLLAQRVRAEAADEQRIILAVAGTRLAQGRRQAEVLARAVALELDRPVQLGYCAAAAPLVSELCEPKPVYILSALLADGWFQQTLEGNTAERISGPMLRGADLAPLFTQLASEAIERLVGPAHADRF